ncbi:HEAT repeat domain-containing protein [Candidatus Riflebacteria bacterium]
MVSPIHQKLFNDLKHPDEDVRTLSAMTLMKVNLDLENYDTYVRLLKESAKDESVAVRYFSRRALHRLLSQGELPIIEQNTDLELVERLYSPDSREQIAAALELGKRKKPQAKEPLLRQLSGETDCYVRSALISSLGKLGQKDVLEKIKPFLADEDPRVRANAVEASAALESADSNLSYLVVMLDDPDNRVRATAAKVLGHFGEEKILTCLEMMIFSGEQWLRQSALYALESVVLPGIEKLIIRILKDADIPLQVTCLKLLENYNTHQVRRFLSSYLQNETKKVARTAKNSLAKLKDQEIQNTNGEEAFREKLNNLVSQGDILKISPSGFLRFKAESQQEKYENHLFETGEYVFGLYKEGEIKDSELQQLGSQIIKFEFIYSKKMEEFRKTGEGKLGNLMKAIFSKNVAENDPTIKYTAERKKRAIIDLGLKALEKFRHKTINYPLLESFTKGLSNIIQDLDLAPNP